VSDNPQDITVLLRRWHAGDQAAAEELFVLLQPELKKIAARCLRRERSNYSLQRTELFDEGFMKLAEANRVIDWRDRGHLFAIYTIKLRRFLIDRARRKPTPEILSLEDLPEGIMAGRSRLEVRLAVDRLLDALEEDSPTTCGILVAKIYFGYEVKEIMEHYRLPQRTVERHLHYGRKWLFERLKQES
jgi:RNA polymerase sigma factor (TIGR02999 family)